MSKQTHIVDAYGDLMSVEGFEVECDFEDGECACGNVEGLYLDEEGRNYPTELMELVADWRRRASELEFEGNEYDSSDDEIKDEMSQVYRQCANELLDRLGLLDRESSASRQHYIETGDYMTYAEVREWNPAQEVVSSGN